MVSSPQVHPVIGAPWGIRLPECVQEHGDRDDRERDGDPVVEAARLCAQCESGQVLAADIVRLTAGRRSRHECHSLGELTLKGLPGPVETVEVMWQPPDRADAETAVPLPARLGVGPATGVVGREAETAAMFCSTEWSPAESAALASSSSSPVHHEFLGTGRTARPNVQLRTPTARAAANRREQAWV